MAWLDLVAANLLARLTYRIAGVNIEFFLARNKRKRLVDIRHKLFRGRRLTHIVSGRLNAARKPLSVIKTADIVALPAMYRNGYIF